MNKRQNSYSSFENNKSRNSIMHNALNNQSNLNKNEVNGGIEPEPMVRKHVSDSQMASVLDRRHLEDLTNHQESQQSQSQSNINMNRARDASKALIIDDALTKLDPVIEFISTLEV